MTSDEVYGFNTFVSTVLSSIYHIFIYMTASCKFESNAESVQAVQLHSFTQNHVLSRVVCALFGSQASCSCLLLIELRNSFVARAE